MMYLNHEQHQRNVFSQELSSELVLCNTCRVWIKKGSAIKLWCLVQKPGSKAVPTGWLIKMMRIDPSFQRKLSQPSITGPELFPKQCRGGRMERRVPSCSIYTSCKHDSIKPQASSPLISTDGLESQRDFFFHSPTQQNYFLLTCAVNALAALQCSALHGALYYTQYKLYKNNCWPACCETWCRTCLFVFLIFFLKT